MLGLNQCLNSQTEICPYCPLAHYVGGGEARREHDSKGTREHVARMEHKKRARNVSGMERQGKCSFRARLK
jgi:hypothetical protein